MSGLLSIQVSMRDSGCLPPLLTREIAAVERQQRYMAGAGDRYSAEDRDLTEAYRVQLQATLAAVQKAREVSAP